MAMLAGPYACWQNTQGRASELFGEFSEKTASSRGGKKMWCVAEINDEYRERMNDVLTLYEQPYDPLLPVLCLDEKNVELHGEKRKPIRNRLGLLRDFEYVRRGTANIFMLTEPKG